MFPSQNPLDLIVHVASVYVNAVPYDMFFYGNPFIVALMFAVPIFILFGGYKYSKKRSLQGMPQTAQEDAHKRYNQNRVRKKEDKSTKKTPFSHLVKADGASGKLLFQRHGWNLLANVLMVLLLMFFISVIVWGISLLIITGNNTGILFNKYIQAFFTVNYVIALAVGIVLPFVICEFFLMDFFLRDHIQNIDSHWNKFLLNSHKKSSLRKGEFTDVRELNLESVKYNPMDYFEDAYRKNSIFLGLERTDSGELKPLLVDKKLWDKSNVQIIGVMGSGKGVQASNALYQCLKYYNDAVIVFDPKDDEFAPHVLKTAGSRFKLIDLTSDKAQFNLFAGITTNELVELLESGFNLGNNGGEADYYRNIDRSAVRALAEQFPNGTNAQELLQGLDKLPKELQEKANNFIFMLKELCGVPVLQTDMGGDLEDFISSGGCLYFIGSIRKNDVITLQKMILTRCIQIIEKRDRYSDTRHVNIFLDEFKYLVTKTALDGMGTLRDKNGNFLIAHQSLGDLKRSVSDMDGEAVKQTVLDVTPLKWIYRVKDIEGAKWASDQTGEIIAENARKRMDSSGGGAELVSAVQEVTEARRNLIDTTTIQHLPDGCGLMISTKVAKIGFSSTIQVARSPIYLTPRPQLEIINKISEIMEVKEEIPPANLPKSTILADSPATTQDTGENQGEALESHDKPMKMSVKF